jgi:predicted amidohydrolase
MARLNLDLWTFDVSAAADSPAAAAALITRRVEESWDAGADIVVFPEFAWMILERFVSGPDPLRKIASLFHNELWPGIRDSLARPGKAAVLGTVPFEMPDGRLRNRAPILCGPHALHQDKIHLTPWETAFSGGGTLRIWSLAGHRIAVMICLDVEIPELAAVLRGQDIDLLLIPSATESVLGIERIGRCASARAVELCCHTAVCHLVGRTSSELIDENLGQLAVFHPSQSPFQDQPRCPPGEIFSGGFHRLSVPLDMDAPGAARSRLGETNPARVQAARIGIERSDFDL